jgi:hypothetical protein
MPLVELEIAPGIVTERTERGAKGRWRDGNRIRFRQGLPEKLGGWLSTLLEGDALEGVVRGLITWQAINGDPLMGIGTHLHLYQLYGGTLENITPYRMATSNFGGTDDTLSDPFEMTSGSSVVEVTHAGHGLLEGTTIYFDGATAVGGLTIDGAYTVSEVIDSSTYTFDAGSDASSSATGGDTVHYAYEISVGAGTGSFRRGFGVGRYSEETYGSPRSAATILLPSRTWALDSWGEDLIANPRNGGIFVWDKSEGFTDNRASAITNAPSEAAFVLVSPVDRHLIAFGCTPVGGSARDPLVIRWCSQNDYTSWTSTRTNTAGQRRLDSASEIISALRTREEILVFTDVSLYAMTFIGPPSTYNIRQIGTGCGLVGPLARAEFTGVTFLMSYEDFFVYDGTLGVLPCDVRNHIFDDLNRTQAAKFFAGLNSAFQEVWFFWCSAASLEVDRYAIFNVEERHWSIGELERTAWVDRGAARLTPSAFDADGMLYVHETDASDNGSAMGEFVESYDVEVPGPGGAPPGDNLMFMRRLVPDFLRMSGPMQVTLKARKYPHGQQVQRGPFTVATSDGYIRPRIRGRQVSLRMESDQALPDTDWRAGTWRMDVRPHGRR